MFTHPGTTYVCKLRNSIVTLLLWYSISIQGPVIISRDHHDVSGTDRLDSNVLLVGTFVCIVC